MSRIRLWNLVITVIRASKLTYQLRIQFYYFQEHVVSRAALMCLVTQYHATLERLVTRQIIVAWRLGNLCDVTVPLSREGGQERITLCFFLFVSNTGCLTVSSLHGWQFVWREEKKNSKKAPSHKENRTETRARAPFFLALIVLSSAL